MRIEDIFAENGIKYITQGNHHCRPGWIQLDCPFCGPRSGKFHLGFNKSQQYFNCWKCGPKRAGDTLALLLSVEVSKALNLVKSVQVDRSEEVEKRQGRLKLPKGIIDLQRVHRDYLSGRGFNPNKLQRLWDIKAIGMATKLSWRIFIPIFYNSELVSWTTRSITENEPRYINAPESDQSINMKDILYGLDHCKHSVIIHEGPIDVWRTGQGYAVATFGTAYTTAQVGKLSRFPKRIVCFDSSKQAQKRAQRLCDDLAVFEGETINVVLDAEDAGSAPAKEIKQLRKLMK